MVLTALAAGCGGADGGTDPGPASGEATAEVGFALAGDPCTTAAQCNDGNPCTVDKCVKKACAYTNKADGTTCSDGNACTKSDTCQAGACAGGPAVVCALPNQCQTASGCNPSTGRCVYLAKAGSACDDSNMCTQNDKCTASVSGVCRGTVRPSGSAGDVCAAGACSGVDHCAGVTCAASDQCHLAGTCIDHATGACSNPSKPDATGLRRQQSKHV